MSVCVTCGRLMNQHYIVDGRTKCVLPKGSDISNLSELEQEYHKHYWNWLEFRKGSKNVEL